MTLLNILDDLLDKTVIGGYDRIGFAVRQQLWDPEDLNVSLAGRTAVVTGANSGLGKVASRELLRRGARVIMVCRNRERGEAARREIIREAGEATRAGAAGANEFKTGAAILAVADMSEVASVRELADRITRENESVHILINNAGALLNERRETSEGFERSFATNVLGYFLLTELLLPKLKASGGARVVNVSSGGMYPVALNVEDPHWRSRPYDGVRAYAETKRAEVLLTQIWAQRERENETSQAGVFFAAMHPGWADTPGVQNSLPNFHALTKAVLRSPEEGADTILWLSVFPGLAPPDSGGFWFDRRRRPTHRMKSTRSGSGDMKRFWDLCRESTGSGPALDESFFETLEEAY